MASTGAEELLQELEAAAADWRRYCVGNYPANLRLALQLGAELSARLKTDPAPSRHQVSINTENVPATDVLVKRLEHLRTVRGILESRGMLDVEASALLVRITEECKTLEDVLVSRALGGEL